MTAEIKKLFQNNVELLDIVDKAILYFREQDYPAALELMPKVSEKMRDVLDGIVGDKEYFELVSTGSLMEMLEGIVEASRAEDYVLLADLLELQLGTLLCNVQELIMKKEDYAFFSEAMYSEQCAVMTEKLRNGGTACPERLFEAPLNPEELLEHIADNRGLIKTFFVVAQLRGIQILENLVEIRHVETYIITADGECTLQQIQRPSVYIRVHTKDTVTESHEVLLKNVVF